MADRCSSRRIFLLQYHKDHQLRGAISGGQTGLKDVIFPINSFLKIFLFKNPQFLFFLACLVKRFTVTCTGILTDHPFAVFLYRKRLVILRTGSPLH